MRPPILRPSRTASSNAAEPSASAAYLDQVNDNDEYSGDSRTQPSPEAISDFQIVNHDFAAQSGGGAGVSIDVPGEQEMAHGEDVNDLKPSTLNAINAAIASYSPLNHLVLQSGFFPTANQETDLSARIDRGLTPLESISARYAFTNTRNVNDAFNTDEQVDLSARGASFIADKSINASLKSTLSETLFNSLGFELAPGTEQ